MRWRANELEWKMGRRLARAMRSEPTEAERVLWQRLRRGSLDGFRFRRQHVIGRFIVDFYCPEANLVIEVDGSAHDARVDRDHQRTAMLRARGLMELRFTNDDVLLDITSVIERIRQALRRRTGHHGDPSRSPRPARRGGGPGG